MKHAKKESPKKRIRRKRVKQLKVLLVLLIIALAGAGITIYRDYQARPGFLEKVWIADRGADYITIAWEKPRNVYKYVITYNGKTIEVGGRNNEAKITELTEDTAYEFSVRADSRERGSQGTAMTWTGTPSNSSGLKRWTPFAARCR